MRFFKAKPHCNNLYLKEKYTQTLFYYFQGSLLLCTKLKAGFLFFLIRTFFELSLTQSFKNEVDFGTFCGFSGLKIPRRRKILEKLIVKILYLNILYLI